MKKNKINCFIVSTSFYLDRKYIQTSALWCSNKSNFIWSILRPEGFLLSHIPISRVLVLPLVLVSFDEKLVTPEQIEWLFVEIYNEMRWDFTSSQVMSDIDRLVRKEFLQRQVMDIIHTLIPKQSLKVRFL